MSVIHPMPEDQFHPMPEDQFLQFLRRALASADFLDDGVKRFTRREMEDFFKLAAAHELLPILLWNLQALKMSDVIHPQMEWRMSHFKDNAIHQSLMVEATLKKVLHLLNREGISTALIKGADMMDRLYPDPWLRPMRDVDLLVKPADFERAGRVLLSAGFQRFIPQGGRTVTDAVFHERTFVLKRPMKENEESLEKNVTMPVEIHKAFCQPKRYIIDYDEIFQRAIPSRYGENLLVYRLDAADGLLQMAVHMAVHTFMLPFRHMVDVHLWIEKLTPDWDQVVGRADVWGVKTAAYFMLSICRQTLDTSIPLIVLERLRPPDWVRRYLALFIKTNGMARMQPLCKSHSARPYRLFPGRLSPLDRSPWTQQIVTPLMQMADRFRMRHHHELVIFALLDSFDKAARFGLDYLLLRLRDKMAAL